MRKRKQKKAKQPEVVRDCLSGELILVSEAHPVMEYSGAGVVREKGFTTRNVTEIHHVYSANGPFYKDTRTVDVDDMGRCLERKMLLDQIESNRKEYADAWERVSILAKSERTLEKKLESYRVFRASLVILAIGYGLIQITILATNLYLVS